MNATIIDIEKVYYDYLNICYDCTNKYNRICNC